MADSDQDPVLGITVRPSEGFSVSHIGRCFHFGSPLCIQTFISNPVGCGGTATAGNPFADPRTRRIACFSMEIAPHPRTGPYSGVIGVLRVLVGDARSRDCLGDRDAKEDAP